MRAIRTQICLAGALTLSACATVTDSDIDRFYAMDCYSLSNEVGRWEARLERAREDELVADIEGIVSDDDDDRDSASVDGIVADSRQSEARDFLDELRRIQYDKRCPVR